MSIIWVFHYGKWVTWWSAPAIFPRLIRGLGYPVSTHEVGILEYVTVEDWDAMYARLRELLALCSITLCIDDSYRVDSEHFR